jgi:DNA-directed RNA polymerase I subunit RPA1
MFDDAPEAGTGRFAFTHEPKEVRFGFLSADEVLRLSVKRITATVSFDALGHPVAGGLYDAALGPTTNEQGPCVTCGLRSAQCPGHLGHVELCAPVYNPIVFAPMYRLLGVVCWHCHRFRHHAFRTRVFKVRLLLLEADMLSEAQSLDEALANSGAGSKAQALFSSAASGEGDAGAGTGGSAKKDKKAGKDSAQSQEHALHCDRVLLRLEAAALDALHGAAKADLMQSGHERRTGRRPRASMSQHARALWKQAVKDFLSHLPKVCENCETHKATLRKDGYSKIFIRHKGEARGAANDAAQRARKTARISVDSDDEDGAGALEDDTTQRELFLHPLEVFAALARVWRQEAEVVSRIWGRRPGGEINVEGYRAFFAQTIAVPPSRFRPPAVMAGMTFDHPHNAALAKVLGLDDQLRGALVESKLKLGKAGGAGAGAEGKEGSSSDNENDDDEGSSLDGRERRAKEEADKLTRALNLWVELQEAVNAFLDSSKAKNVPGADAAPGVRQGLEKKEGLFRQNMMGKRVNYAARSVISPDPYIGTNEVGLPVRFATRLCYPEPVTAWNASELAQAVRNGADVHPGALFVEDQDGRVIDLSKRDERQREDLAEQIRDATYASPLGGAGGAHDSGKPRFTPGDEDGVWKRERNNAHAPLTLRRQHKVWRHARTGDVMLANRQPTLHKPSLMAHRVRVIANPAMQTIRLHYANCNSYNADFDGDEINLHLPQSENCRAEGFEVAYTNHQYCSTTDGEPLRGLIQDHVGMGVWLTKQDTFLTRDEFAQMLFTACQAMPARSPDLPVPPPCILKPRQLWSGKQVVSAMLMHLVGTSEPSELLTMGPVKSKVPPAAWKNWPENKNPTRSQAAAIAVIGDNEGGPLSQTRVVVRQGHLCTGVLDKAQFGAAEHGLVHCVYELYGANAAGELLSAFGRLLTFCAQKWGHTCAIEDLLLKRDAELARTQVIAGSVLKGVALSAEFAGLGADAARRLESGELSFEDVAAALRHRVRVQGTKADEAQLDGAMQAVTSAVTTEVISESLPKGQLKPFPLNSFSLMIFSGAKGSLVNHSQISCGLGQQALEGRRVPRTIAGKSLPCFSAFDATPRAGGFVTDRFLTGVRPQEYFFHCMAGREGLIDTAVKTANSGYLQRCLVKHLENLSVAYDRTVRQSDGNVVQFLYGGDGLDVVNTSFLKGTPETVGFLYSNVPALAKRLKVGDQPGELDLSKGDGLLNVSEALRRHKLLKRTLTKSATLKARQVAIFSGSRVDARRPRRAAASDAAAVAPPAGYPEAAMLPGLFRATVLRTNREDKTVDLKYEADGAVALRVPVTGDKSQYVFGVVPDPVMSELSSDTHLGAISERLQSKLDEYIAENPHRLLDGPDDELTLQQLIWLKYLRSLAAPGENVGVIAAQGIGEPSTQMTLNTFHLAGHGAGNVTLGIPRLRELLMTASRNISTPSMTLPLLQFKKAASDAKQARAAADALAASLYHLRFAEVLRVAQGGIKVVEALVRRGHGAELESGAEAAASSRGAARGTGEWYREYDIELLLLPMAVLKAEFGLTWGQVCRRVGYDLCPALCKAVQKELKRSLGKTLKRVGGKAIRDDAGQDGDVGEDEAKDDEDKPRRRANNGESREDAELAEAEEEEEADELAEQGEEGENATLKLGRKKEVDGYDDDDEDHEAEEDLDGEAEEDNAANEVEPGSEPERGGKRGRGSRNRGDSGSDSDSGSGSGSGSDRDRDRDRGGKTSATRKTKEPGSASKASAASVVTTVLEVPMGVSSCTFWAGATASAERSDGTPATVSIKLRFRASDKKLLMVGIAESAAQQATVRSTPGVKAAFVVEGKPDASGDKELSVQTAGCNLAAAWDLAERVDVNRIKTNDVGAMLSLYGVEAARACLVEQVGAVFSVYGITVDHRHLSLVADYMTFEGGYKPLNRAGIDSSTSPFVRMTFETSAAFLTQAALEGEVDALDSASARLCLGQLLRSGTGAFDMLVPNEERPPSTVDDAEAERRREKRNKKKERKSKGHDE